jgi:hypothetical protein
MADSARHPDAVDLAEYAEGLLDESRRQAVEGHVPDCADCTHVLAELAALPRAMAQARVPPLPDDVAIRLDQAIAAEATTRASECGGTAARVAPIRRPRRWLAPLASAAAVIAAIAIVVPSIDIGSNDSADSAGGADRAATSREFEDRASGLRGLAPQSGSVALTSTHFGREVIDAYYSGSGSVRVAKRLVSAPTDRAYRDTTESVPGLCSLASGSPVPGGEVDAITLDGDPARLLRRDKGDAVDVIAFVCDANGPQVLDAVTLRRR